MSELIQKINRKRKEGTLVDSIKIRLFSKFYINLDSDYRNTIFLAGSGRSGTTWLSNIINYKNEYRYLFEPFHSKKVPLCSHFYYKQYLRPDNDESSFLLPAENILSGAIRNSWIDRFNKKFFCTKRLIKDIRANLMLKWIKVHFPEIKLIFLMRHPGAVVVSRIKLNWKTNLSSFLSQPLLMDDYLNDFKREIEKADTQFEKSLFLWCIENYVPLKQLSNDDFHLIFYEHLVFNPEEELDKLFSFIGRDYDESIYRIMKKPSLTVRKGNDLLTGDSLIDKWKSDILSLFELDKIYSTDSSPIQTSF